MVRLNRRNRAIPYATWNCADRSLSWANLSHIIDSASAVPSEVSAVMTVWQAGRLAHRFRFDPVRVIRRCSQACSGVHVLFSRQGPRLAEVGAPPDDWQLPANCCPGGFSSHARLFWCAVQVWGASGIAFSVRSGCICPAQICAAALGAATLACPAWRCTCSGLIRFAHRRGA